MIMVMKLQGQVGFLALLSGFLIYYYTSQTYDFAAYMQPSYDELLDIPTPVVSSSTAHRLSLSASSIFTSRNTDPWRRIIQNHHIYSNGTLRSSNHRQQQQQKPPIKDVLNQIMGTAAADTIGSEGDVTTTAKTSSIDSNQISAKNNPYTDSDAILFQSVVQDGILPVEAYERLPIPVQIMEQYKQQHSVQTLQRERDSADKNIQHRRYSIIFYQCPLQAGNRLHHYLNDMLWSIVTNRTILWKYWDTETCVEYGQHFSMNICKHAGNISDCDPILRRAEWIPSYDEWSEKLDLDDTYVLPYYTINHYTNPQKGARGDDAFPWNDGNDETAVGVDVKYNAQQVVVFPQNRNVLKELGTLSKTNYFLKSELARRTAQGLYSLGWQFLFGMMQRYSFDLTESIQAYAKSSVDGGSIDFRSDYTIGLHSRHMFKANDGCEISNEIRCLQQVLTEKAQTMSRLKHEKPCRVLLMSDRACTIDGVRNWLNNHGGDYGSACTIETVNHEKTPQYIAEHGPFAGAGFYKDLALVSQARSAFISTLRSSSYLVWELISFNSKMDEWQRAVSSGQASTRTTQWDNDSELRHCSLGNGS